MSFHHLTPHVRLLHHFAQPTEQLVSQSLDVQGQSYKLVAFWVLMEIADGYQLLEQLLLFALYTQIARLPQEQQLPNAKLGDQRVFQMELLVFQDQPAHHTQPRLLVEILELMELVSGLPQLELQQQELADSNCVQMLLQI